MALTISLCSVVLKVSYIHNYSNEVWVLISGKRLCVGYHCYCLPEVEFLMSLYSAWNMKLQTLTKSKCLNLDKRTIILKVCHVLNLFYLWSNSQFFLKFVHWTLVKVSNLGWPNPTCIPPPISCWHKCNNKNEEFAQLCLGCVFNSKIIIIYHSMNLVSLLIYVAFQA